MQGLTSAVAESFLMPLGILPRMRMLACGITVRTDNSRAATDEAWWRKEYAHALWAPLSTYCDALDKTSTPVQAFRADIAEAEPEALSRAIAAVTDEVRELDEQRIPDCAPYLIPKRRGVLPPANAVCMARVVAERNRDELDKTVPKLPSASVPWWVWALGAYIVLDRR